MSDYKALDINISWSSRKATWSNLASNVIGLIGCKLLEWVQKIYAKKN